MSFSKNAIGHPERMIAAQSTDRRPGSQRETFPRVTISDFQTLLHGALESDDFM
jgi:hypothetical protein